MHSSWPLYVPQPAARSAAVTSPIPWLLFCWRRLPDLSPSSLVGRRRYYPSAFYPSFVAKWVSYAADWAPIYSRYYRADQSGGASIRFSDVFLMSGDCCVDNGCSFVLSGCLEAAAVWKWVILLLMVDWLLCCRLFDDVVVVVVSGVCCPGCCLYSLSVVEVVCRFVCLLSLLVDSCVASWLSVALVVCCIGFLLHWLSTCCLVCLIDVKKNVDTKN